MPLLTSRMIFISHAWSYNNHYETVVGWFDDAANFSWKNCSVPSDNALEDKSSKGLSVGMTRQISPAKVVVILGGMYAAHSEWIDYEISEAKRMGKTIIGVKPWGQERVPKVVSDASICEMIGWNSASVVAAVRQYT